MKKLRLLLTSCGVSRLQISKKNNISLLIFFLAYISKIIKQIVGGHGMTRPLPTSFMDWVYIMYSRSNEI